MSYNGWDYSINLIFPTGEYEVVMAKQVYDLLKLNLGNTVTLYGYTVLGDKGEIIIRPNSLLGVRAGKYTGAANIDTIHASMINIEK